MNKPMSHERLGELEAKIPKLPPLTGNTYLTADEANELFGEIHRQQVVVAMWDEYFSENETGIRHARITELEAEVEHLRRVCRANDKGAAGLMDQVVELSKDPEPSLQGVFDSAVRYRAAGGSKGLTDVFEAADWPRIVLRAGFVALADRHGLDPSIIDKVEWK